MILNLKMHQPRLSIITVSRNHGPFLRSTIESILRQSYRDYEHVVVDGASTDDTVDILKQYPHIRWVSEPDDPEYGALGAYRKAINMAAGDYVIQCCVSDGFLHQDWFKQCVAVLDADPQVSLVWGFPQYMTEEGDLGKISYAQFFDEPPPQKMDFLAYWLATGFIFPEGNCCVRREVLARCFPQCQPTDLFRFNGHLEFSFKFNTWGYLPYFLPLIANYGRIHAGQRGQLHHHQEQPQKEKYRRWVKDYRRQLLSGRVRHSFRDGASQVIMELTSEALRTYRKNIWRYRITESRLMRRDLYTMWQKLQRKLSPYWR